MVLLPAAFLLLSSLFKHFYKLITLHTNENRLFWLKAISCLLFYLKALWNFLLMQKYHWGLILQIDEDRFPLRQIRTLRNISGNCLFLWLFPSRRGAQGGRGWGLCKEWGKTVFLLCACLWYMCVRLRVSVCEHSTFSIFGKKIAQDLWRKFLGRWLLPWNLFFSHLIMKEMVP